MTQEGASNVLRRAAYLACTLLVAATLHWGREILIPLALAVFLSFLLAPLVRQVERLRVGRVISVIVVVGAGFGVLFAVGGLVASQAADFVDAIPQYRHNITTKVRQLRHSLPTVSRASDAVEQIREQIKDEMEVPPDQTTAGAPADAAPPLPPSAPGPSADPSRTDDPPLRVEVVETQSDLLATLGSVIGPVVHPLTSAGIALVLVVFFLVYREDLRDRVIRIGGRAHVYVTTAALNESGRRVTRYLGAQLLANGLNGVAIGAGLLVLGVPDPLMWGLIAAVMRFIPFLGTWISAIFPIALSAAIADGWLQPLAVAGWFLVVDLFSANFVEPYFYGARTGASPMAILFSFLFWTWLWGAVGLLLATPITVCLIVLGKHIPALEIFYVLLSDEPALEPKVRFYQRLLAMDRKEAVETARRFAKEHDPVQLVDDMVLPALAQLENDRLAKDVDEPRMALALDVVDRILAEDLAKAPADTTSPAPWLAGGAALLVPGGGAFDETALVLLRHLGGTSAANLVSVTSAALTGEIIERVQREQPSGVIVATVEPRDLRRLTYVCKRIAAAAPTCPILGLCVTASEPSRKRCLRLQRLENVSTYTSMAELIAALTASASLLSPATPLPPAITPLPATPLGGQTAAAPP